MLMGGCVCGKHPIEDMQCLNIHRGQKVDGEWLIEIV